MNQERIALLEKYILEEPENPFNQYALAMEYYEEMPGEALKLLLKLSQNYGNYLPTYFKLAHLLWELELWNQAETAFEKGIALAVEQNDNKALSELRSAYQNFSFDRS